MCLWWLCTQRILLFSGSVVSDSLWPHEPQHASPPYPSPTAGVYPNPCPLSGDAMQPSHPLLSPSFSCLQSFPVSRSFQMSQQFTSVGQIIGASASASVLEYSGLISFRMDWLDLLAVQGTHKGLLQHHSSEASILRCSAFFIAQISHPYMTTGKP